ncbi:NAD(P)H-hydrate dehydratase [Herminiimonas sp. CN]|uniref:NAD(P)H-hydrate dehydratase n=1 Tax=Herminiimonas sp. CN TaxID=1349818 RepID=UPI0004739C7E|nr:NAD(P)H-hydrate dehydratase [Herminiimonas sp. CN]
MPTRHALHSIAEIRRIEQAALAGLPSGTLMRRAGQAAAAAAIALLQPATPDAQVLVLVGPGDNGGDALEVAAALAQAGIAVTALIAGSAPSSTDAQQALQRARSSAAVFKDGAFLPEIPATRWALIVDGLFGIGLARPIAGVYRRLIDSINQLACPVLALDIPSGLDADTGTIVGSGNSGVAARAQQTITFIADKPGLHTCDGRDCAGAVTVAALALDARHFDCAPPSMHLATLAEFSRALQVRRHNSHKGSNGDVVIVGGAAGMHGAPVLAGRAAIQSGAGRVIAGFIGAAPAFDSAQPELMCRPVAQCAFAATVVIGPGLGNSDAALAALRQTLQSDARLVLDADALNLIAADPALQQTLAQRAAAAIMTPHPLEAARLLGTPSAAIQADRIAAARRLARSYHAIIVLKGSGSIIADPQGKIVINPTGNPGLATAGTGDVLAGIIGALLSQGWPAWEAAIAAVWLHGNAADELVAAGQGPIGLTASELVPLVRRSLNRLSNQYGTVR